MRKQSQRPPIRPLPPILPHFSEPLFFFSLIMLSSMLRRFWWDFWACPATRGGQLGHCPLSLPLSFFSVSLCSPQCCRFGTIFGQARQQRLPPPTPKFRNPEKPPVSPHKRVNYSLVFPFQHPFCRRRARKVDFFNYLTVLQTKCTHICYKNVSA